MPLPRFLTAIVPVLLFASTQHSIASITENNDTQITLTRSVMSGSTGSELHTVTLRTQHWLAELAPDNGGQLIRLRHLPTGRDILHYPATADEYFAQPERHGVPILFPPNRVASGRFERNGKVYNLPITDGLFKHHIHGVLLRLPWQITQNTCVTGDKHPFSATAEPAVNAHSASGAAQPEPAATVNTGEQPPAITLSVLHDESLPSFAGYPHRFRLSQTYTFYPDYVRHDITLENLDPIGTTPLPFGLGFHTAFHLPADETVRLRVRGPDSYWEIASAVRLTTGDTIPWTEAETFHTPQGQILTPRQPVNRHYRSVSEIIDGKPFRGAMLDFPDKDIRITYQVDDAFGHWYLWRPPDNMNIICIEPMTWIVNAPNLELPQEITGVRDLPAGEVWQSWSSIGISPLPATAKQ